MKKIYVGNLPYQTTEQDLEKKFQQFGEIKETSIIRDRYTNECRGFAFITFATAESAQQSLASNGQDFQGREMKVNLARLEGKTKRFANNRNKNASNKRGGFGNNNHSNSRDKNRW